MIKAIRIGLFDAKEHADYYMRYSRGFYGDEVLSRHQPYRENFFSALKEIETSPEVNGSASRPGSGDCCPQIQILNAERKAGVNVTRRRSDAHRPEQAGQDFEALALLVPELICEGAG